MPSTDVVELTRDDIVYPFHKDTPYVRIGLGHGHQVDVDPTPAYGHDAALVRLVLDATAAAFPIDWPVSISLLPAESTSRTNGTTHVDVDYDGPKDAKGD